MEFAPPLSFASIPRPAFGSAAQHLDAPPRLTTKADRRHVRAAKTAAELLPDLPQPGEAVHALMLGTFDLCQVITATVRRFRTAGTFGLPRCATRSGTSRTCVPCSKAGRPTRSRSRCS